MTKALTLFLSLSFLPLTSYGDYVPGRTRTSAKAHLTVKSSSGIFQGFRNAEALQLVTDGKGVSGFSLKLGKTNLVFHVEKTQRIRCGTRYFARTQGGQIFRLLLTEVQQDHCGHLSEDAWYLDVVTKRTLKDLSSRAQMSGSPEYFYLSQ
jgi:hypothetical protein